MIDFKKNLKHYSDIYINDSLDFNVRTKIRERE